MKRSSIITTMLMFIACSTMAQQNCSRFYPMQEGASFEYTSYDKKGKMEHKASYAVTDVRSGDGSTEAVMSISLTDEKGEKIYDTDYSFTCTGNKVSVDYESLLPSQMIEQYQGMEMDITGTDIEIPNNLEVGQQLQDANVTLSISMSGINMKTTVDMTDRKVERKETVTTPAGTFECFVIYSNNLSKMMMVNKNFPSRIWLAEGVGMIKQESYKENGKLISSTELTKHTK